MKNNLKTLAAKAATPGREIRAFDDALAEIGITLTEWLEAARKQWTCSWPWKQLPFVDGDEGMYVIGKLLRSYHGVWFGYWAQYPAHKWDCGEYATVRDLVVGVWQIANGDVARFGMFIPNRYDEYEDAVPAFVGTADECAEWRYNNGGHAATLRMGVAAPLLPLVIGDLSSDSGEFIAKRETPEGIVFMRYRGRIVHDEVFPATD